MRPPHGHESAVRQHLRGGRGLGAGGVPLWGLPAAAQNSRVVYLELGVGSNTPAIIKYPFWKYTRANPKAVYACVNLGEAMAPEEIAGQSICIDADLGSVLALLA